MRVDRHASYRQAAAKATLSEKNPARVQVGGKNLYLNRARDGAWVICSFGHDVGIAHERGVIFDPTEYGGHGSNHLRRMAGYRRVPNVDRLVWQGPTPIITSQGVFFTDAEVKLEEIGNGFFEPHLTDRSLESFLVGVAEETGVGSPHNWGFVVEASVPETAERHIEYVSPRSRPLYLLPGTTKRTVRVLITAFEIHGWGIAGNWQARHGSGILGSEDAYEVLGRLNSGQPQMGTRETALRHLERAHQRFELKTLGFKDDEAKQATEATVKSRAKRQKVYSPV